MEIIERQIKVSGNNYTFAVIPIGDIHFKSNMFNKDLWDNFKREVSKIKYQKFFVGVGDITDYDRGSTRRRRAEMFIDRSSEYEMEDYIYKTMLDREVIPEMSFLNKDNCLGLLVGDHYREFSPLDREYKNSTDYICKKLGVNNLGFGMAIIKLKINFTNARMCYTILARHGIGFNKDIAGSIRRFNEFANKWDGVDMFIKGHSHNEFSVTTRKHIPESKNKRLCNRRVVMLNAGSFRASYSIGDLDYSEEREYSPTNNDMLVALVKVTNNNGEVEVKHTIQQIQID